MANSSASGLGVDTRLYYRFALVNGVDIVGRTTTSGSLNVVLRPNIEYSLSLYQASTNRSSVYHGETNSSGLVTDLGPIILDEFGGSDSDEDRIPDIGEIAIGTSPTLRDTDGDGITDDAEITQGLDPLDNRGFPTGIIASLPLAGPAREVVVEGSTAYVATGGHGLAIVETGQFNNPILVGQIDLAGTASDVAVSAELELVAVATGVSGLQIVDVTVPQAPTLRRTVNINASRVEFVDGVAYAAAGASLTSVDIVSGSILQTLNLGGSTITDVVSEGNILYTMDAGRRIRAVDLSTGVMVGRGSVVLPNGGGKLFVGNGIAYAAAADTTQGSYATANVSNPNGLVVISGTDAPIEKPPGTAIVANGSGLGLLIGQSQRVTGDPSSLQVVDTTDPNDTYNLLLEISLPNPPAGIALASGIAFVADGSAGLQVVNYLPFDNRGVAPTVTISTSAGDADPAAPGVQVIEGATIPVLADVQDDVQARNVELLVNGVVVRNDVSFPFDFFAVAPAISPEATTFTLQVRATDTGGNVGLSEELTFELVADVFAPTIVSIDPSAGTLRVEGQQTVRVRFRSPWTPPLRHSTTSASATLTAPSSTPLTFNCATTTVWLSSRLRACPAADMRF